MKIYGKLNESMQTIIADNVTYNPSADEILMQNERPTSEHIANAQGEWVLPSVSIDEIKQSLINQVQNHLDNACKERGYDNGFACASYATSSVPKFKSEAEAYVLWRDKVWSYCYEQLELFEQGERDIPTDIIEELPILEWDDVATMA